MKYSFILPCRNEEKAIGICITKIKETMQRLCINEKDYEIIVSDSSSDSSPRIALSLGAKLVKHNKEGYGNAYLEAFKVASGEILILGDADDSYDFSDVLKLLNAAEDHDLVLGKRTFFHKNSMPWVNKHIGIPFLSGVLRLFFRTNIQDAHTGFRVIKRSALEKLNLRTTGMEFASEMIIKALKNNLRIKEVPIHYYARKGETKLRRIPDGWRHLRFMLLYSPAFLFLIPGLVLFLIGIITMILLYLGIFSILGIKLYYHPMFLSSMLIIAGYQLMIFSIFAKTYAITHLGEKSRNMKKLYSWLTLENVSIIGMIVFILGIFIYGKIFISWIMSGFGSLNEIKNSIVALTLVLMGIQTISSAFMLSILGIKEK